MLLAWIGFVSLGIYAFEMLELERELEGGAEHRFGHQ